MIRELDDTPSPQAQGGEWYCPACRTTVPGVEVTFSEHHEACGTPVASTPVSARDGDEVEQIGAVLFRDWNPNDRSEGGPFEYHRQRIREAIAFIRSTDAALTSGASGVDAGLFALHLMGPDDIYAAPSYEAALRVANAVNLQFADYPVKPYAVVVPWARSAELHAAGLADWEREFNAAAPAHQGQGERGEGNG